MLITSITLLDYSEKLNEKLKLRRIEINRGNESYPIPPLMELSTLVLNYFPSQWTRLDTIDEFRFPSSLTI